jgi:Transposase DDE domain
MIFGRVFERFVARTPISVMARATMEHALAPAALDQIFSLQTEKQYTRELLFSSLVDLMSIVVSKVAPSVHAAYQAVADTLPVSLASVYNKLNGLEPCVSAAMVAHTAGQLAPVICAMGGNIPALLPGFKVRILDGNHFASTSRRLQVLKGSVAGPLPGHALVVLDPELMLAIHMIPCEDGHAQERSLSEKVLELIEPRDVWIADRNFCTTRLLAGIAERHGYFIIRHHANMRLSATGPVRQVGTAKTGRVTEQLMQCLSADGTALNVRRVVVQLDKKTRDGDFEVAILTNLDSALVDGLRVAELYRKRWTLETMFQSLTAMLEGEIATLGYPRAALFGFSIALAAYNTLSTVQAALRGKYGVNKVQEEVSSFYVANEVRAMALGMDVAVDASCWVQFQRMTSIELAQLMLDWAGGVKLAKLRRHPRASKKPVPKRTRFAEHTHVSTARLLSESRKKTP